MRALFNAGFVVTCFISIILYSCQRNSNAIDVEGSWELIEAYRGGRSIESLSDAYFRFNNDQMITNLFRDEISYPFEISNGEIVQKANEVHHFEIVESTDSTMSLTFVYMNREFDIVMMKIE